jgi:hypothetical protein
MSLSRSLRSRDDLLGSGSGYIDILRDSWKTLGNQHMDLLYMDRGNRLVLNPAATFYVHCSQFSPRASYATVVVSNLREYYLTSVQRTII